MKTLVLILSAIVNLTWAPDSSRFAFTRDNDLYVCGRNSSDTLRLTSDGSEQVLNGYASWVYYEEILGRPSRYRAFWWSPDSRKIAFFRSDQSEVPVFPIYSAKGQDGFLKMTRYPKVGEPNPEVRIGIIDLDRPEETVWADFNRDEDQYFGKPFWSADSRFLFVQREPRIQQHLDLFRVNAADGRKECVYSEDSPTWLEWIEGMLFDDKGLYMARDFESGWQQVYFLSYDGKILRRLTDGQNWRVKLLRHDTKSGSLYFTAQRDSRVYSSLYRLDRRGKVTRLTPEGYNVERAWFSRDMRSVYAKLSNSATRPFEWSSRAPQSTLGEAGKEGSVPRIVSIPAVDGQPMFASMLLPAGFDPSRKYPVHFEIYGGPNTAYVTDRWREPDRWWSDNGIIHIVADCRASGHTGRSGRDLVFRDLTTVPVQDFVTWAEWAASLPYVDAARIGVEGFSFGGTMTAMLLMRHPGLFRCGIAGGGVYDWTLYDSHYTERFMLTPDLNPEGFEAARVLSYVKDAPSSMNLKITHGTGDDNVHFQNTLQLVDMLQRSGKQFELMIYPDGMHGYRGAQGRHSREADRQFWLKYLKTNNL